MRKFGYFILFIMIIAILGAFGTRCVPSVLLSFKENEVKAHTLNMSDSIYYRQTYNNCSAYSSMAALNITRGEVADPEILASQMKFRIMKNLTLPYGVTHILKEHGVKVREYVLYAYKDERKAAFLRDKIMHGYPVILLVDSHGVQHYVTVVGYDEEGFMLYDSMQEASSEAASESSLRITVRDSRCIKGNRYMSDDELMSVWNLGGKKIFFRNWCVVASSDVERICIEKNSLGYFERHKADFEPYQHDMGFGEVCDDKGKNPLFIRTVHLKDNTYLNEIRIGKKSSSDPLVLSYRNMLVYSPSCDIMENNPMPSYYKLINRTSLSDWYEVYIDDWYY